MFEIKHLNKHRGLMIMLYKSKSLSPKYTGKTKMCKGIGSLIKNYVHTSLKES